MKRIPRPLPIADIQLAAKKPKDVLDKLADLGQTLNHGLVTISREIQKLRIKSHNTEIPLSEREIRVILESVKVLLTAERQQLEAQKAAELNHKASEMSDAEVMEYAKSILQIPTPEETPNDK